MKNAIHKKRNIVIALLAVLLVGIISGMVWLVTPYHSRLAWKVDEWLHTKRIPYTHNNIYTDGVYGILTDIRNEIDLPDVLYISNVQSIGYTVDGEVTDIYLFLYGEQANGAAGSWLVSCDAYAGKDGDASELLVYTDGALSGNTVTNGFKDSMFLAPMIDLSKAIGLEEHSQNYAQRYGCERLEIVYCGYRTMANNGSSYVVDADGSLHATSMIDSTCEGYEISLHSADGDYEPERYYANWLTSDDYVDPVTAAEAQHESALDAQRVDASLQGTGYMDTTDGSMYCYVSDEIGYHLFVADAAAGSRFYQLERTTDGGTTWTMQNRDPFLGIIGVVGGMQFEDELHGRIWLDSPSGGTKEICETVDGGATFTAVEEDATDSE